uniref:Integrase core domain containing protein n=1 Tax=Solanum tuberosum TaxID=4113 RepID=M1DBZ9_SOLTU
MIYNFGNTGQNYSREKQYERLANRDQGNWQNRDGYRNDRSGVYMPPGNRNRASGSSSGFKQEDMLAKVLKEEVESEQVDDVEDDQPIEKPVGAKENGVEEGLGLKIEEHAGSPSWAVPRDMVPFTGNFTARHKHLPNMGATGNWFTEGFTIRQTLYGPSSLS